jgi:3-oxoacyl-[acyl-carrier-protein] synthase III
MALMSVGILGIGTYLPPEIRRNDWWPADVVARWTAKRSDSPPSAPPTTPAMARVMAAMAEQASDPFRGVVQRHVMPADMRSVDMEAKAAEAALDRAGIARSDVDFLLVHTAVPEYLLANSATVLHQMLGLRASCLALEVQASAYSFLAQLALAEPLIATGRARYALLVQSSAATRLVEQADPVSAALGDAATAVVVGPVPEGQGILAAVHRTDGRCPGSLVASVRGGRWYDGRAVLHVADPVGERQLFLETVDRGNDVISEVLAASGCGASDVDFFAAHQGTPWLRRLTQDHAGLTRARSVDLFSKTGYVFAASLPLVLATAEADGLIASKDLVAIFGGGTGITVGATLLRWGR